MSYFRLIIVWVSMCRWFHQNFLKFLGLVFKIERVFSYKKDDIVEGPYFLIQKFLFLSLCHRIVWVRNLAGGSQLVVCVNIPSSMFVDTSDLSLSDFFHLSFTFTCQRSLSFYPFPCTCVDLPPPTRTFLSSSKEGDSIYIYFSTVTLLFSLHLYMESTNSKKSRFLL